MGEERPNVSFLGVRSAVTSMVPMPRSCQDFGIFISTLEQSGQCIALVEDIIPGAMIDVEGKAKVGAATGCGLCCLKDNV